MKRLTLHRRASSLSTLCEVMQKSSFNSAEKASESKDDEDFRLCYGKY
jgi:hypothetical protein